MNQAFLRNDMWWLHLHSSHSQPSNSVAAWPSNIIHWSYDWLIWTIRHPAIWYHVMSTNTVHTWTQLQCNSGHSCATMHNLCRWMVLFIFGFTHIHRCVLALFTQHFPEFCENKSQAYYSDRIKPKISTILEQLALKCCSKSRRVYINKRSYLSLKRVQGLKILSFFLFVQILLLKIIWCKEFGFLFWNLGFMLVSVDAYVVFISHLISLWWIQIKEHIA